MQIGSAGYCQEICFSFNRTMFAIKRKECRCLNHSPTEKEVSPLACNAVCYKANDRSDELYFDECGGDGTYSVFVSGNEDESTLGSESSCVAIHCSGDSNSTFYFHKNCSIHYIPVCSKHKNVSKTWMESMQLCKSENPSTYITPEVYLNDVEKTCKNVGRHLNPADIYWLGIAKEAYYGNDIGEVITKEDEDLFIQCMRCTIKDDCSFVSCEKKLNGTVFCKKHLEQNLMEKSSPLITEGIHTSTSAYQHGKPQITTQSRESSTTQTKTATTTLSTATVNRSSFSTQKTTQYTVSSSTKTKNTTMTSIKTTERTTADENHLKENKGAFQIIVPIAIAVVGVGILLIIIIACIWHCKKMHVDQSRVHKLKSRKEERDLRAVSSNVNGVINHAYFTIELQEQGISSCNVEDKIESPYTDEKEDTYHHLRDKESKYDKDENEYSYDTTKSVVAKKDEYEDNEGTYDHLRDEKCSNADDTYHHAFITRKERSEYDVTEIRKEYILSSPYNQVEIISNENNFEEKSSSNLSEKLSEDHTYFILEQN